MACEELDENDAQFSQKLAHVEGLQVLGFSADGKQLYSAGADSFIRVHSSEDFDGEPRLIEHLNAAITSIHCSFDSMAVSYESGEICLFSHQAPHDFTNLITRCNPGAVPRCIKFGYNGRKLAVASDELLIKVVDTRDPTQVQLLSGHEKTVTGLSWSPDGSSLVSSSCDGSLRLWDMASDSADPQCLREIKDIIQPGEPGSAMTAEAHWHPSGKFFVVASKTHEIVMVSSEDYSRIGSFDSDGHASAISVLSWSPNGNYLASAGEDKQIIVWETSSRQPIFKLKHAIATSEAISAILWEPGTGGNTIAFADTTGQLTRWTSVIPSSKPHPSDGPSLYGRGQQQQQSKSAAPVTNGHAPGGASRAPKPAANSLLDEDDDDGWIDDDMNGAYKDDDNESLPPPVDIGVSSKRPTGFTSGGLTLTSGGGHQPQAAFQPGATPWKEKRRYLAFNHVGIIHAVDRDMHHLVTVEFHDRGAHRGYHFDDNYKFSMASLGEHGALYACAKQGDLPSVIHYRPFDSWTLQADWHLNLPLGESAVAVGVGGIPTATLDADLRPAVGNSCCVVATDAGYLRFFSTSGLQLHLIDLGEDIVSLTVGKEWAMVVHRRQGLVNDGRQHLNYTIFDCDTFELVQQGALPLMQGVRLQWVGFTEEQLPAIYKSNGVLSFLQRTRRPGQGRWTASLDTNTLARREGKQESYWPVSVGSNQMHVIILKGEEKHPFFPTPLLQEMSLQMPMAGLDGQQGQLEENFLRDTLISGHLKDGLDPQDRTQRGRVTSITLDIDKHLLKIMQIACKAEKLEQALDAARLLGQPQSLDAAAKLASFFHQRGLSERIELIKEARSGEGSLERERKESKWGHLVDNRTLVDSVQEAAGYDSRLAPRADSNSLSKPVSLTGTSKRSLGDSSALGQMPGRTAPVMQHNDSALATSSDPPEYDMMAPMEEDIPEAADEETQVVDSLAATPVAPAPPKKAANPFAKQNKPSVPAPTSSNPFAKKSNGKASDLKRSESFFDRVEGHGTESETKGSKDKSKQSTLFGIPPGQPAEPKKKNAGRKRKAAAPEETKEIDESQKISSSSSGLSKFLHKPVAPEQSGQSDGSEGAKRQRLDEDDATQPIEETEGA